MLKKCFPCVSQNVVKNDEKKILVFHVYRGMGVASMSSLLDVVSQAPSSIGAATVRCYFEKMRKF